MTDTHANTCRFLTAAYDIVNTISNGSFQRAAQTNDAARLATSAQTTAEKIAFDLLSRLVTGAALAVTHGVEPENLRFDDHIVELNNIVVGVLNRIAQDAG